MTSSFSRISFLPLQPHPPAPAVEGTDLTPVRPAVGACEVVVYTPQADATLAELPVEKIEHLVWVWTDRFAALEARPEIEYIFLFENKGREIGVTLTHPHGQIYAYPFIPPKIQVELNAAKKHWDTHGTNLFLDVLKAGTRRWTAYCHAKQQLCRDRALLRPLPLRSAYYRPCAK